MISAMWSKACDHLAFFHIVYVQGFIYDKEFSEHDTAAGYDDLLAAVDPDKAYAHYKCQKKDKPEDWAVFTHIAWIQQW